MLDAVLARSYRADVETDLSPRRAAPVTAVELGQSGIRPLQQKGSNAGII